MKSDRELFERWVTKECEAIQAEIDKEFDPKAKFYRPVGNWKDNWEEGANSVYPLLEEAMEALVLVVNGEQTIYAGKLHCEKTLQSIRKKLGAE